MHQLRERVFSPQFRLVLMPEMPSRAGAGVSGPDQLQPMRSGNKSSQQTRQHDDFLHSLTFDAVCRVHKSRANTKKRKDLARVGTVRAVMLRPMKGRPTVRHAPRALTAGRELPLASNVSRDSLLRQMQARCCAHAFAWATP
jgi:hypothetical protein